MTSSGLEMIQMLQSKINKIENDLYALDNSKTVELRFSIIDDEDIEIGSRQTHIVSSNYAKDFLKQELEFYKSNLKFVKERTL